MEKLLKKLQKLQAEAMSNDISFMIMTNIEEIHVSVLIGEVPARFFFNKSMCDKTVMQSIRKIKKLIKYENQYNKTTID